MALAERLNYHWRQLGTGFGFILLFGGGAVLATLFFPLMALRRSANADQAARNQRMIHFIFRLYLWILTSLRLISVDISHIRPLASGGGRIIIANHPTLLDVVLLMAVLPRCQCIVKRALWQNPYLGGIMRYAGYIRNDLPFEDMLAACRASLQAGSDLIIFPEGTRSEPGKPIRFKRGTARIALFLEADMQLVKIRCEPLALTKSHAWWQVPPQRPHFTITAGPLVEVNAHQRYEYQSIATRKLNRTLEGYFAESSVS